MRFSSAARCRGIRDTVWALAFEVHDSAPKIAFARALAGGCRPLPSNMSEIDASGRQRRTETGGASR
jgi:hypothetical protein